MNILELKQLANHCAALDIKTYDDLQKFKDEFGGTISNRVLVNLANACFCVGGKKA